MMFIIYGLSADGTKQYFNGFNQDGCVKWSMDTLRLLRPDELDDIARLVSNRDYERRIYFVELNELFPTEIV